MPLASSRLLPLAPPLHTPPRFDTPDLPLREKARHEDRALLDVLRRAHPRLFGPTSPRLRASVIIPARNEERRLPALVTALARQRDAEGRPFEPGVVEVLVLLNNCTDRSEWALAEAAARHGLRVRAASVTLRGADAHVGRARQMLMDAACARLLSVGRPDGVICSTDADTLPAPDWVSQTLAEIERGADAVGGRALLVSEERATLAPGVRRLYLLDLAYRRALESVRGLYAPEPWDPLPRHHHHFGASLAVTACAYGAVGGMPAVRTSEDEALVRALQGAHRRLRHSPSVRVYTSARACGRADGGLADAFSYWAGCVGARREPPVEPAADAERRLARLGLHRHACAGTSPPTALLATPPATPDRGEPISIAIRGLRQTVAALRPLPFHARLDRARSLAP